VLQNKILVEMVTDKTKLEMAEIRDSRPSPKNKEKYLDM
jgi:hypothetical protein